VVFAGAVAAHEADALAAQDVGGEAVDDCLIAVDFGEVLEFERVLAAGSHLVQSGCRGVRCWSGEVVGLQPPLPLCAYW